MLSTLLPFRDREACSTTAASARSILCLSFGVFILHTFTSEAGAWRKNSLRENTCAVPPPTHFYDVPSPLFYASIERKFDMLDAWTRRYHADYADRTWGIASIQRYAMVKTKFIFETLITAFPLSVETTVCELGFNAGHSSILFLETLPKAKVFSFDIGEGTFTIPNKDMLKGVYGPRFEFVLGDSAKTLPGFVGEVECDVAFADGQKGFDMRYADVLALSRISKKGALLFLDEVSDSACASGKASERECSLSTSTYSGETLAYNRLVREGVIDVTNCIETKTKNDGFCVASFK